MKKFLYVHAESITHYLCLLRAVKRMLLTSFKIIYDIPYYIYIIKYNITFKSLNEHHLIYILYK